MLPAYYYPEQAASPYLGNNIREAMCNAGFILDLYTPMPTRGVSEEIRVEYKERKIEYKYDNKLVIHRFPMYREGKNPINRALRYVLCWCVQFGKGLCAKDIGLIYLASTPPIQGVLGCLLKKIKRVPFVYNLQDVFPDSLAGTGLVRKDGLIWRIGRVVENFTYKHADKIIVISEDFKRNIMAKGVPEDKIVVVYNWVDQNAVRPIKKANNPLYDEFGLDRKKFRVVYAGNLGYAQNIDVIVNVARRLKENKQIEFVIFGSGGQEIDIKRCIETENMNNIKIFPLQSSEKVSCVYSLGDLCIVSCKAGLGGCAMPSKTWSILSVARPVLASFDEGELKSLLEDNNCGIFTKAGNVDALVNAIVEASKVPELCDEMGRNGRQFIMDHLTKEVGTRKYVDVIKSVVG